MCVIHNFHTWCENLLSRLEALHMYLLLMVYIHEEVKRMSYVSLILDVLNFYMDFLSRTKRNHYTMLTVCKKS